MKVLSTMRDVATATTYDDATVAIESYFDAGTQRALAVERHEDHTVYTMGSGYDAALCMLQLWSIDSEWIGHSWVPECSGNRITIRRLRK